MDVGFISARGSDHITFLVMGLTNKCIKLQNPFGVLL